MSRKNGHGGARQGAGRKVGSGRFKEPTKVMRVPESKVPEIKAWLAQKIEQTELKTDHPILDVFTPSFDTHIKLPFFGTHIRAGFPSPADDYIESRLDLNEKLIRNQNATFIVKVEGDSMINSGIDEGDLLIVDRSITPKNGHIVIASLDGELTVKRLIQTQEGVFLKAENENYPLIVINDSTDMMIWGVVTSTIRQFNQGT